MSKFTNQEHLDWAVDQFRQMDTEKLIDYVVNTFHFYKEAIRTMNGREEEIYQDYRLARDELKYRTGKLAHSRVNTDAGKVV